MLVTIAQHFFEANRQWKIGENPDVSRETAARWIADGKATADTDGVRGDSQGAAFGIGNMIFRDDFKRPDTTAGTLGAGWVLKGPYVSSYPLPASSYGQIESGAYTEPNGQVVYATRQLRSTPRKLTARWSWSDLANGGTGFRTIALILSSSANIIDTMLHITIINSQCLIQKRIAGGSFITLNATTGMTGGSLALLDTPHEATVFVDGSTVRVMIDDAFDQTVNDPDFQSAIGPYMAVEHYSVGVLRWPMRILDVAAYG